MNVVLRNEVERKAIHLGASLLPISLFVLGPEAGTIVVATALIVAIAVDVARLRIPAVKVFFEKQFGGALRPHEAHELTGSSYMCLAALVCIVLFTVPIAVAALLFLTVGDTAAALVGRRWGRHPLTPGKTYEGTLACLVCCSIIGVVVPGVPVTAGLFGAVVATVVELFGIGTLDDNFGIPVLSGLSMWIVASLVG